MSLLDVLDFCIIKFGNKTITYPLRIYSVAICIFISSFCFSQNINKSKSVDSLNRLLKTEMHDSSRINSLILLGNLLRSNAPDSAKRICQEILQLSEKINNETGRIKAYYLLASIARDNKNYNKAIHNLNLGLVILRKQGKNNIIAKNAKFQKRLSTYLHELGIISYYSGEFDAALKYYKEALAIDQNLELLNGEVTKLTNIGIVHFSKGNYSIALKYHFESLKKREVIGDPKLMASGFGNIGVVYAEQGNYPKALEYYYEALKYDMQTKHKRGNGIRLGNIGIIHWQLGDLDLALEYYLKALKLAQELGNQKHISSWYGNIAIIYFDQNKLEKSMEYHFKALKIAEQIDNKMLISKQLGNIGNLYRKYGDQQTSSKISRDSLYGLALNYTQRAITLKQKLGEKNDIAIFLGNAGNLYLKTGNFEQAEKAMLTSLSIADSIGSLIDMCEGHKNLSQLYSSTVRFELAYQHELEYSIFSDSLFNEENSRDIGKLESKHEFEMAEIERVRSEAETLQILREEREYKNKLQYSGILLLLVLLFTFVIYSGRLRLPINVGNGIMFFTFLLLFEFVLVLFDPYIEPIVGNAPIFKLIINVVLAGIIFSLHTFFEKLLKTRLFRPKPIKTNMEIDGKSNDKENDSNDIINNNKNPHQKTIKKFMFICLMSWIGFGYVIQEKSSNQSINKIDSLRNLIPANIHDTLRISAMNTLAEKLMYQNPDTSILLSKKALEIALKNDFKKWVGDAHAKLGVFNYLKGDYTNALKHHFETLQIKESLQDAKGISATLGNIGIVYAEQEDYTTAMKYYFKRTEIDEKHNFREYMAINFANIGVIYSDMKAYENALEYYFKALEIDQELDNQEGMAVVYGNIGIVYDFMKNHTKAVEYYLKELKITQELNLRQYEATVNANIGSLFTELKMYDEAEQYLLNALKISAEMSALDITRQIEESLSWLYAQTKDYHEAFLHQKAYNQAKDSLFNQEKNKAIGKLEAKHEYKMAEMEQLKIEKQQAKRLALTQMRRNTIQYAVIVLVLVILFFAILISGKLSVPFKFVEGTIFITFLLLFEFLLVMTDPYVEQYAQGEPIFKLFINISFAICILPLHRYFEGRLQGRLIRN